MKRRANKAVVIILSCIGALIACAAVFYVYVINSAEAYDLCADMCMWGWEDYVTYPMLSAELRDIVSEEEFSDRSPEGKLRMYEKLNGLVLDDRAGDKFDGRTSWFKTPCHELIETNGEHYAVDLSIDVVWKFGKTEVRNFTARIREPKGYD